jgi:hypothetical protein
MAETINDDEHRSDLSTNDARQGVTFGRMRYVLGISVALVVVAFFAIWLSNYLPL